MNHLSTLIHPLVLGTSLGFSTGWYCLLTCGISFAAFMSVREHGSKAAKVLLYFAGRFVIYLAAAILASLMVRELQSFLQLVRRPILILSGLYLFFLSGNPRPGPCLAERPASAFMLGILSGLQPCPPFLALFGSSLASTGPVNTLLMFMSFFITSSIMILPSLIPMAVSRTRIVREVARFALCTAAVVLLFLGLNGIMHVSHQVRQAMLDAEKAPRIMDHVFLWTGIIAASLSVLLKNKILKFISLGFSVVLLGFISGTYLSVNHIFEILGGSFNFMFLSPILILSAFAFVMLLFSGRLFCDTLCPFGAVIELGRAGLEKTGLKLFDTDIPVLRLGKYLALAGYVVFFLPKGTAYPFEPFKAFFSLGLASFSGILALFFLVFSLVDKKAYCKYFCGLNGIFILLPALRDRAESLISRKHGNI